ncbi:glycine zipper 2TM domain-containing protein [Neisseriaceae bacterium JH1-16]|nr:glycine zipper 2TM domain-containing protein [Neisseriaceae bacterium JH1-16]
MKRILPLALLLAAAGAEAATFTDHATVLRSDPQYGTVTDNCPAPALNTDDVANAVGGLVTAENGGALLGGIVGGVLGHQVGGGRGKTAATIVGALGGAMAGRTIAQNRNGTAQPQPVTQACASRQVVTGYAVTYEYRGQRETVTMPYDPGKKLELTVTAQPVVR